MSEHLSASSVGSTSSGLIQRIKAHDQGAWRRLVRIYGPLVDFWIRRAGLQAADAQDVFQEVFRAIARNIGNFRKDRPGDSFRAWLRTITRSKLVDHYRRLADQPQATGGSDAQQRLEQLAADVEDDEPGEGGEMETLRHRALESIRAEFEEKTWQAFWRVTVEGHEVKEVAADLGITPSAVRLFKSRILRRLREEMEGLEP